MLSRLRRRGGAAAALASLLPLALGSRLLARAEEATTPPTTPPIVATRPRPPAYKLDPKLYLPTSKLTPGMRGYGLTVFHGAKIERFDVAILGVLRKANNGRDLILVRLGGNPNLGRVSDIIAGMSGSPVYVNGKIVGAVAYGSTFTRERIGYLTPIEDMLDAWDPALPQYPDGFDPAAPRPSSTDLGEPVTLEGRQYSRLRVLRPGEQVAEAGAAGPGVLTLRPLATPIMVSGVPASRWERLSKALAGLGLDARQGIGGGAAAAVGKDGKPALPASPLQPGGGVAMSLVTGDMDLTGVGTLTFRAGDRIVAFGHPMLSIGPIDAPMSTVYIHDILPSYYESSKIGSPVRQVGAFTQDRPFSVAGTVGAKPAMVPVTVRVSDRSTGRTRTFRCQVVRHPRLTRILAAEAAGVAIAEVHSEPGDVMATVRTTVAADEIGSVTRVTRVYDAFSIDNAATGDLEQLLRLLSANSFYPVPIRSVALDVTIDAGRQTAQIERAFLDRTRCEPGDTVNVHAVLRPYQRPRTVVTVPVRIPPTVPDGSVLTVSVQGGGSSGGSGFSFGGGDLGGFVLRSGSDDFSSAVNVRQLVRRYLDQDRADTLVARVALPTSAVSVQGERLSGLPPNIEAVLRGGTGSAGSRSSGARLERDEVKAGVPTGYVLSGSQTVSIRVARRGTPEAGGAAAAPSFTGVSPSVSGDGAGGGVNVSAGRPRAEGDGPGESAPDDAADSPDPSLRAAGAGGLAAAPAADVVAPLQRAVVAGGPSGTVGPPLPPSVAAAASGGPKAVGRMPLVWRQASAADFRAASLLDGVTVSSAGEVRLAPRLTRVAESVAVPYYWCLAPDGRGGVYAGTGDGGAIGRVAADGSQTLYAATGALEVLSLAAAPDGALYAGTAPSGRICRVAPGGGKATTLFQAPEKYVLALALSPDGKTLWAGTGGPRARVWRVPLEGDGKPTAVYESAEGSVTALAVAPDGSVYAGTAPSGLVVRVAGGGATGDARPAVVLYDTGEAAVTGLAAGPDGTVCAATMAPGRGALYRIDAATGAADLLLGRAPAEGAPLTGLQRAPDGTLYTASGGAVVAVRPSPDGDAVVRTYEAPSGADIQILSVLLGEGGRVWASTGNTGGVYRLSEGADGKAAGSGSGQLVSRVFDARQSSRWGTIRWTARVPEGASVLLQTRTGDIPQPDASWSEWSRAYASGSAGERIASPPGRYLQYRATLTGRDADPPALRSVEAFYLPPDQAPRLTLLAPAGGEVWRGAQTVRWSASDPDRDSLSYEVALSADGGKTWKSVDASAATTKAAAPSAGAATAAPPSGRAALEEALASHPEISPAMRARILADAPPSSPIGGQAAGRAVAAQTLTPQPPLSQAREGESGGGSGAAAIIRATTLSLNTARLPDGVYLLRVTASDKPSNPVGALTAEKVSGEFRVVNRPPSLVLLKSGMKTGADRAVTLEGVALQTGAAVRAVQFRLDGGDWQAAAAADGLFDGTLESFTLTTPKLSPGAHVLEVQALDEAGNATTEKVIMPLRLDTPASRGLY